MNDTNVCRPDGYISPAERKENMNTLYNAAVSFVRSQLAERVTSSEVTKHRDLMLYILSAETA